MVQFQEARNGHRGRLQDHYRALGLTPEASFGEIQRAYWRLAFGDLDSAERSALNEAYDVLGNDLRRREYDALWQESGLDTATEAAKPAPQQPPRRADAGLAGKLGWPSI